MTTPRWVQSRCDRDFIDRIAIMTLRSHIRFFAITIIALMIAITSPRSRSPRRDKYNAAAIAISSPGSQSCPWNRGSDFSNRAAIAIIALRSLLLRCDRDHRFAIASAICFNCIAIAVIAPRFAITASLSLIIFYKGTSIALEKCKKDCNIF